MDERLGSTRDQRMVDRGHLNVLSVLHFVGAGLAALGIVFVLLHYTLMSAVMHSAAPPTDFFDAFRWVYLVLGGWYGTSLVLNILAGVYLRAQKHRTFCFVVAGLNCLHVPLGTVLGIFTILVLVRDSVGAAFEAGTHGYRVE